MIKALPLPRIFCSGLKLFSSTGKPVKIKYCGVDDAAILPVAASPGTKFQAVNGGEVFWMLRFKDGEAELDIRKRFIRKKRKPVDLTPGEFDIPVMLMRHPDRVFTRNE
jgi:hypothetical protein